MKKLMLVTGAHEIEEEFGNKVVKYLQSLPIDIDSLIYHPVSDNEGSHAFSFEEQKIAYEEVQKQINMNNPQLLIDLHHGFDFVPYKFVITSSYREKWLDFTKMAGEKIGPICVEQHAYFHRKKDIRGTTLLQLEPGSDYANLEVLLQICNTKGAQDLFMKYDDKPDISTSRELLTYLIRGEEYEHVVHSTALLISGMCDYALGRLRGQSFLGLFPGLD